MLFACEGEEDNDWPESLVELSGEKWRRASRDYFSYDNIGQPVLEFNQENFFDDVGRWIGSSISGPKAFEWSEPFLDYSGFEVITEQRVRDSSADNYSLVSRLNEQGFLIFEESREDTQAPRTEIDYDFSVDASGRVNSIKTISGIPSSLDHQIKEFDYTYDSSNRIEAVATKSYLESQPNDFSDETIDFFYDAKGRLERKEVGGVVLETLVWDDLEKRRETTRYEIDTVSLTSTEIFRTTVQFQKATCASIQYAFSEELSKACLELNSFE